MNAAKILASTSVWFSTSAGYSSFMMMNQDFPKLQTAYSVEYDDLPHTHHSFHKSPKVYETSFAWARRMMDDLAAQMLLQ